MAVGHCPLNSVKTSSSGFYIHEMHRKTYMSVVDTLSRFQILAMAATNKERAVEF
jgi:uncharacterized membrane protein